MKNHWFLTPVFAQIDGYVSLRQNGPSNYTLDRSSKRPVATGLGLVFQISQNPGNHNRSDHQRAWTATAVRSFFSLVQFGLRSFCGPRTGLLNTISRAPSPRALMMTIYSQHPPPSTTATMSNDSPSTPPHSTTSTLWCWWWWHNPPLPSSNRHWMKLHCPHLTMEIYVSTCTTSKFFFLFSSHLQH